MSTASQYGAAETKCRFRRMTKEENGCMFALQHGNVAGAKMFVNKTVFVLGAGASWHYGYPTGEELTKKVMAKALIAEDYFRRAGSNTLADMITQRPLYLVRNEPSGTAAGGLDQMKKQWDAAASECKHLRTRLQTVDPLVIDYFLGQNSDLRDIGKLLIAWVLLEAEARSKPGQGNFNRLELADRRGESGPRALMEPDNWYRFIMHKLVTSCPDAASLLKNNVTFVIFNYDVSLEYRLHRGLTAISQFGDDESVIDRFFAMHRFIHIYGRLRQIPYDEPPQIDPNFVPGRFHVADRGAELAHWQSAKKLFDQCFEASKQLKTIAPFEKIEDENVQIARRVIQEASCVYILGYGFDENNSKLLGLDKALRLSVGTGKSVLFTNFGDSNRVNKMASRLIFGRPDMLLSTKPAVIGSLQDEGYLCEKSTRDVYGALAVDFDSPEEQVTHR
jgi:hypothetical protein